jgi:hypothetical protein
MADPHRPPDDDDQLVQDEREAEGEEELVVVACGVEAANPGVFDDEAQERHSDWGQEQANPEIPDEADHRDQEVGANGKERAMREVRDVEHARDERKPEPHQGVQHPGRDPVKDLAEKEIQKLPISLQAAYSFGSGVSPVASTSARSSSSRMLALRLQRRKK